MRQRPSFSSEIERDGVWSSCAGQQAIHLPSPVRPASSKFASLRALTGVYSSGLKPDFAVTRFVPRVLNSWRACRRARNGGRMVITYLLPVRETAELSGFRWL